MSSANALLTAGETEQRIAAKHRVGHHEHHDAAFENGRRVPFLTTDEVLRPIFEQDELPTHGPDYELAGKAVLEVLRVVLGDAVSQVAAGQINRTTVGTRALCLMWILNQSAFEGSPSLRQLAKRCGVTPALLSTIAAGLRDAYRIANRSQLSHDSYRMKFSDAKQDLVVCNECEMEERNDEEKN